MRSSGAFYHFILPQMISMRCIFHVSETANQFFFLLNMSEWHFSCRSNYNAQWRSTVTLSDKQENALKDLRQLFQKYPFQLHNCFFNEHEHDPWHCVQEIVDHSEYEDLVHAFELFTPTYQVLWQTYKPQLETWQTRLQRYADDTAFQKRLKNIATALKSIENREYFTVSLIMHPETGARPAGGANAGEATTTLEIPTNSDIERYHIEHALCVLTHEIAHLFFDHSPMPEYIQHIVAAHSLTEEHLRNITPQRTPTETLKELLLEQCAPYGYFCEQLNEQFSPAAHIAPRLYKARDSMTAFASGEETAPWHSIARYITWQMYPLVARYYHANTPFDNKLLERLIAYLSNPDL